MGLAATGSRISGTGEFIRQGPGEAGPQEAEKEAMFTMM